MQAYTTSNTIMIPFIVSLAGALPCFPNEFAHPLPHQNHTIFDQDSQSLYGAESYSFISQATKLELSDELKFQNIVDFSEKLKKESTGVPSDIAEIIQREFWNLV